MTTPKSPEPWLRGTLTEVPAVSRAALHALQLAEEDLLRWCSDLTDQEIDARPCGLPSVGFHLRHIARSLDRLLTYAEGRELSAEQIAALKSEMSTGMTKPELFGELLSAFKDAACRIRNLQNEVLEESRSIGKLRLPASVGGLLVHVADHTQRHVGQAITTAKVLVANRPANCN